MARVPMTKQERSGLKQQRRAGLAGNSFMDDFADDVDAIVQVQRPSEMLCHRIRKIHICIQPTVHAAHAFADHQGSEKPSMWRLSLRHSQPASCMECWHSSAPILGLVTVLWRIAWPGWHQPQHRVCLSLQMVWSRCSIHL